VKKDKNKKARKEAEKKGLKSEFSHLPLLLRVSP